MAVDIGFTPETGDWFFTANVDLGVVSGDQQVAQRIHTRIKIARGEWIYDLDGTLGSRLKEALHGPREKVFPEIQQWVYEALEPMSDIQIVDVEVINDPYDIRRVDVRVFFNPVLTSDELGTLTPETIVENVSLTIF